MRGQALEATSKSKGNLAHQAAAAVVVIGSWVAHEVWVDVPPGVEAAATTILGILFGLMIRTRINGGTTGTPDVT